MIKKTKKISKDKVVYIKRIYNDNSNHISVFNVNNITNFGHTYSEYDTYLNILINDNNVYYSSNINTTVDITKLDELYLEFINGNYSKFSIIDYQSRIDDQIHTQIFIN